MGGFRIPDFPGPAGPFRLPDQFPPDPRKGGSIGNTGPIGQVGQPVSRMQEDPRRRRERMQSLGGPQLRDPRMGGNQNIAPMLQAASMNHP